MRLYGRLSHSGAGKSAVLWGAAIIMQAISNVLYFFFKETYYSDFYIVFFNSTIRFIRWHAWIPNVTEWLTCLMYYLWCASWFKSQKSRVSNTCHFNECQHDNLTLYGLYVGGSHLFLWRGVSDGLENVHRFFVHKKRETRGHVNDCGVNCKRRRLKSIMAFFWTLKTILKHHLVHQIIHFVTWI